MKAYLVVFALFIAWPAFGQDSSSKKVDQFLELLRDDDVQTWLSHREQESPSAEQNVSGLVEWEANTRTRVRGAITAIPQVPDQIRATASRVRSDALSHGYAPIAFLGGALILVGALLEMWFRSRRKKGTGLLSDFLPIAVFATTISIVFFTVPWPPLGRVTMLAYLSAFVAFRFASTAMDLSINDIRVRWRAKIFVAIALLGLSSSVVGDALSVPPPVREAISILFSLILLTLAVEGVWSTMKHSRTIKTALSLYLVVAWLLWIVGLPGLFWLSIYAVALPPAIKAAEALAAFGLRDAASHDVRSVLVVRGARAVVIVLAVVWLSFVWRLQPDSLARQNPAVTSLLYGLIKSIVVILLADLAWHLAKAAIDRRMALSQHDAGSGPAQAARANRLRTLLPILRNVLAAVVIAVAGLIVLAELGVEIAPLIAGAGIFGVALGFGSQTLVKDVISGVFYMLDDAFRVGEYIQAKSYKGTVEGFSLRSVRLRHHRGPVYTVPFGELGAVENMSRDWGVVKFRISVGFDTDIEKVRKLVKKIGAELQADEEIGPLFIEPLKMKGLEEFGDYGIALSFGMTLRPSPLQSMVRRRANVKIREAFVENSIEFATPSVQVGGDDRQAAAAMTAARVQQGRLAAAEQ